MARTSWWRYERLGLRARTAVALGLTSLLLASALALLAYGLVRRSLVDERESSAIRQAYTNAQVVRSGIRAGDLDVARLLASLQVGSDGEALLRIRDRWFSGSVELSEDSVPAALRGGVDDGRAGHQTFRHDGDPFFAVGVPITAIDGAYFEVTSLQDVERTLDLLGRALAVGGIGAAVVGAAVGALASGTVLRPLRRMATVARRIAGGDRTSRLDADGDAALEPLVQAFNEMLDDLRDRIEREARFASDVTHELRAPLAALGAAVSVVNRRRAELPESAVTAVEALEEQVEAFNRLVQDLLEISRFDAGAARLERRPLDLEAFARVAVEDRADGVVVRTDGHGPYVVDVDTRRIQQVLANLLDNAAHYAGGATAVSLERDADAVRLVVEDAGPGVPPDEREEIFERFARGDGAMAPGAPRGTGLGLALVEEHVRLHGGRVWVEDRPGGGSRFVVELGAGR